MKAPGSKTVLLTDAKIELLKVGFEKVSKLFVLLYYYSAHLNSPKLTPFPSYLEGEMSCNVRTCNMPSMKCCTALT